MMRKIITTLICILTVVGAFADTPENMLQFCVAKLKGANSISTEFTMKVNGKSYSGSLRSKGKKFTVTTPGSSTWYNGTDIWTYTPESGEVTVWHPSASELAESNPLLYLSTSSDYTVKAGNSASTVILTPKKRNTGVKNITLTVNQATGLPKQLDIAANGGNIKIVVNNIRLNTPIEDSVFKYPSSKYPKVRVTDLR